MFSSDWSLMKSSASAVAVGRRSRGRALPEQETRLSRLKALDVVHRAV